MTNQLVTNLVAASESIAGIQSKAFDDYVREYVKGSAAFWALAKSIDSDATDSVSDDLVEKMKKLCKKEGAAWTPSPATVSRLRTFKRSKPEIVAAFKLACAKYPTFSAETDDIKLVVKPMEIGNYVSFIGQYEKGWFSKDGKVQQKGKEGLRAKFEKGQARKAAKLTSYKFPTDGMEGTDRVLMLRKQAHDLAALIERETAALTEAQRKTVNTDFSKALKKVVDADKA